MGSVIQLKTKINNAYLDLRNSVEHKLELVEDKIKNKLKSDVSLVEKMTTYNFSTGGKRLRALITLGSAKLCGYSKGGRDVNLAACVELIHAATLVTAGLFLIIRCSVLFEECPIILFVVALAGSLTAFFAASVGLVQNDLKKVIAYSTCSQLGFMMFACGLSHYSIALFHLANHALFKALLFLSAGCVIHGLLDEQDLRKMGGLLQILPVSYTMILIGSLALVGFPFLTGFYSKDVVLEIALATPTFIGNFAH